MTINKKKSALITFHVIAVAAITSGYICMYKKTKKPKLDINSLSSF